MTVTLFPGHKDLFFIPLQASPIYPVYSVTHVSGLHPPRPPFRTPCLDSGHDLRDELF